MISAVLITKNAERHLAAVLAAVRGCADDIVVLDSASTDATAAIASAAGARVVDEPFAGFGPQKRRAVALARHDWILSLDADEVLDTEAQAALCALDRSDAGRSWRLRRRTFVGTREIRHGWAAHDAPVRLFHRTRTNFTEAPVHESVPPTADVRTLPGTLHHFSFTDAGDMLTRAARYARHKADRLRARGRRPGALALAARAAWAFNRCWLLQRGFLDGRLGVAAALAAAVDAALPGTLLDD